MEGFGSGIFHRIFLALVPFQHLTFEEVSGLWCFSCVVFLVQVAVIPCRKMFTAPLFLMNYKVVKTLQKKM